MKLFYRQPSNQLPVPAPVTGQLATVWVEDDDEVVRVQVTEVMVKKDEVKVRSFGKMELPDIGPEH